jgi:hypothetical protein
VRNITASTNISTGSTVESTDNFEKDMTSSSSTTFQSYSKKKKTNSRALVCQ